VSAVSRRPAAAPSLVELAPRHKLGLTLTNPVLLAAGVVGYGDAALPGLELGRLGGFVTAPVTRRPWRGELPQVAETPGGVLWQRSLWNPGVRVVVRDYAGLWRRSRAPVIVHLAGDDPDELAAVASTLEGTPGVAGLELDLLDAHHDEAGSLEEAFEQVQAVRAAADLPILARLPLSTSDEAVQALAEMRAVDALVLAQPPAGLHYDAARGVRVIGELHSRMLTPLLAARVADLAGWVGIPLVACGGVHSVEDALGYLAVGAAAVQIDTAVWVDPGLPGRIVAALEGGEVSQRMGNSGWGTADGEQRMGNW
jgi:dihydroorotate dehydrogenase (NAD+) catalytic subunit